MESNSIEVDGLMGQHMSHNVRFNLGRALSTTSPLQVKEAHFSGMHISLG